MLDSSRRVAIVPVPHLMTARLQRKTLGAIVVALASVVQCASGMLVEVTSEARASQTTEWSGGLYPAGFAIDGDPDTFSHTDSSSPNNAWVLR